MKQFFAVLAMVSALMIADSKADNTAEHCTDPAKDFVEIIEKLSEQGFPVEALTEKQTQSYMKIAREIAPIPDLLGTVIVIVENTNEAAIAFIFKDKMRCGYIKTTWQLHTLAMKAAKGEPL